MNGAPYTVGLTGGVASGKSLVSMAFRELGVPVLDADQASRAVVQPGQPALAEIAARFGGALVQADGQLDRAALRRIVFADAAARRDLEQITHPRIRAHIRDWMAAQQAPYAVLENAILIESGMDRLVDRVLVVDVPESLQRARLAARDGIDDTLIAQMLAAQSPRERRLQAADDVIDNSGAPEAAREAVATLHRDYLERAQRQRDLSRG